VRILTWDLATDRANLFRRGRFAWPLKSSKAEISVLLNRLFSWRSAKFERLAGRLSSSTATERSSRWGALTFLVRTGYGAQVEKEAAADYVVDDLVAAVESLGKNTEVMPQRRWGRGDFG
jgi:poly-gamma-glutamate capsule biosynthesis protein CapA/YwtB (metallophosphatase superfamily)